MRSRQKLFAQPGDSNYHKLSVLLHPLAHLEQTEILSQFLPADHHFHRPRNDPGQTSAVKVIPRAESLVKSYDALEYVTRHMFVSKATPWRKALACVSFLSGRGWLKLETADLRKRIIS